MSLYGLIIGIAIVIGLEYFQKHQQLIPRRHLNLLSLTTIFFALVGARTYHVLSSWEYYSHHLSQIPATWNGGLGIFGGIIGGMVPIALYCFFYKINFLSLLNSITPILPFCQAVGRLGNFINQEIPSWWVEAILNLLLFFYIQVSPQNPTAKFFIGYGTIRLLTELLRTDTWIIEQLRITNIISLIFILLGFILSMWPVSKKQK